MRVLGAVIAAVLAVSAAACGGSDAGSLPPNPDESILHPGSAAEQVKAWAKNGGLDLETAVNDDAHAVTLAWAQVDMPTLIKECRQFSTDVASAQAYPAIPDAATDSAWQSGLRDLGAASRLCYAGASTRNTALLNRAELESRRGTLSMIIVLKRIIQFGRPS